VFERQVVGLAIGQQCPAQHDGLCEYSTYLFGVVAQEELEETVVVVIEQQTLHVEALLHLYECVEVILYFLGSAE
jgi:hypothetical protein